MSKKLYRSRSNSVIGGVCGGVGAYFDVDPVIVRLVWLVLLLAFGTGGLAYIVCLLVIPKEPEHRDYVDVEPKESE